MRIGMLIFSIGIVLLSLSMININIPVNHTVLITKPYSMSVPNVAKGYIILINNDSNVSLTVRVIHNGVNIYKIPKVLKLTSGNWEFSIFSESYTQKVRQTVNETVHLPCGNVTQEKIVTILKEINTTRPIYPAMIKIEITQMNLVNNKNSIEIMGIAMIILGLSIYILEKKNIIFF